MHPRPLIAAIVVALATAIAAAGCGIDDPYADLNARLQSAITTSNEVPTGARERARTPVADPAPSPAAAVERFAQRYVNWDYRTLAGIQRRLAAMSVGEASATNARAAAHTPADYELRRARVANHGRIVALAPIRPPRRWTYVVVTVERTTGSRVYDGLRPAFHTTIATAQPVDGGWALSRWEPQT